jgi:hypothetical protein
LVALGLTAPDLALRGPVSPFRPTFLAMNDSPGFQAPMSKTLAPITVSYRRQSVKPVY